MRAGVGGVIKDACLVVLFTRELLQYSSVISSSLDVYIFVYLFFFLCYIRKCVFFVFITTVANAITATTVYTTVTRYYYCSFHYYS